VWWWVYMNENLDIQIKDLAEKIASNKFHAENLKLNVDRKITGKEFNAIKEHIKQYSDYYKISTRNYKNNRKLYLFYKFFFKNNQQIEITFIHIYESPFMFLRYIRVKSLNKGE